MRRIRGERSILRRDKQTGPSESTTNQIPLEGLASKTEFALSMEKSGDTLKAACSF